MLRHSGGLSGQRVGLHYILMCCWLTLLFFASPSFAQSTAGLKQTIPASSSASSIVQQAQFEGELEVLHSDDFKHRKSHTRYSLKTDSGEPYELKFKGKVPQQLTGTKLRVKGEKSGNILYLDTSSSGSVQVLASPTVPNSFGAQNTLVMLVNFQDQPTNRPWTVDQVKSFVFGTVSDFFKENAYQNTWLTGDVYGWYTAPTNSTTCDTYTLQTYAKQAATAAGANLSAYSHLLYIWPNNPNCGWSGASTLGGSPSESVINGYLDLKTIGHELGHGFGLAHSHSWTCTDGSIIGTNTNCSKLEYGDGLDIMGWGVPVHFNSFQKEHLGWLNGGVMPPITAVQSSGTYVIDPYETAGTNPKALKILKSTDPVTGQKTWYYVEYRQSLGFDNVLTSSSSMMNTSNVLNGVVIRTGNPQDIESSYLLDMTPATYDLYMRDPALDVGLSFTDATAGVTITTRWVNSTNAAIDVTFANDTVSTTCTHAAPSVVLSSSQSTAVAAGSPVSYTVAVTNNDNSACSASTFNLQSSVPSGWAGNLGVSALTVSPGSAASTTLTVTSPAMAPAGSYTVGTTASNSTSSAFTASGSSIYSIGATTATSFSTTVATDKANYTKGSTVTITGMVTSGSTPIANASVTFTVTKPNGAVVTQTAITGSNGQAVYQLKLSRQKDPSGVYQVKDTASNNGASAAGSTSFSVQ